MNLCISFCFCGRPGHGQCWLKAGCLDLRALPGAERIESFWLMISLVMVGDLGICIFADGCIGVVLGLAAFDGAGVGGGKLPPTDTTAKPLAINQFWGSCHDERSKYGLTQSRFGEHNGGEA